MPASRPQLVVIDTETTGLDPSRDRVIEIGAVRLDGRLEVVDRLTTVVDPDRPIPLMIQRMTGITDADVAGAPSFAEAFAALRDFAAEALLVGQNLAFDLDMLAAEAARAGLPPLGGPSFDTLEGSLLLFPELDRHNLREMAEHLALHPQAHRALPDAEDTAALFVALCRRAAILPEAERRLLEAAEWAPLRTLDRFPTPSGETPPPTPARRSPEPPADAHSNEMPAALPCDHGDWKLAFGPQGELAAALPGFTVRSGQLDLAADIAGVFESGGIAVFEAGTGMGKSLAYLLPAAFHAAAHGRRVVVSTRTKVLQRQLAERELPLVGRCLPDGWRWALLMGRENYLCRRRLDDALAEALRGLPDRERLLGLAYLAGRTRRGEVDVSGLPYRATKELPALTDLARELRAAHATCTGRRCGARERCHWRLARTRAERAHLVCVNHALLLVGGETLPAFDELVVDEAHLLPDEAVLAGTETVDRVLIETLLADARGRRGQRSLATVLAAAARAADDEAAAAFRLATAGFEQAVREIPSLTDDVGVSLNELATVSGVDGDHPERPGADPAYGRSLLLTAGLQEQPAFDPYATAGAALAAGLGALAQAASLAAGALPDDHRDRPRAVSLAAEAAAAAALLVDLTAPLSPDLVGWADLAADDVADGGRRSRPAAAGRPPAPSWALNRAPLSGAPLIRERLWERLRSAVLTSATLSVAGSFAYFRAQAGLGADLGVSERVFPSPFDYRRQAALVLEHDPETPFRHDDAPARQAERLRRLIEVTGGRLLALFTNRRQLRQVAAEIGDHAEDEGVVLLAQGLHGSAAALADEFRSHPSTALLGVDALWTGQDFPGDALVCLVIAKLPFPRQDAVFEARKRAAHEEGRDWFGSFYLPETILRFRQGFGRLIRTETDRGVVVVLDHRLTQKRYQEQFLASLPALEVVRAAPDDLPEAVEAQLRRLGALPDDRRA